MDNKVEQSLQSPLDSSLGFLNFDNINELKKLIFNTPLAETLINEEKLQILKDKLTAGELQIQSQSLASKLIEHIYSHNTEMA